MHKTMPKVRSVRRHAE